MKFLRLKPGYGETVLAEGDVEIPEQEQELIEAFRRELDAGMWAAVPTETGGGRRRGRARAELRRGAPRRRACDLLPARRRGASRRGGSRRGARAGHWRGRPSRAPVGARPPAARRRAGASSAAPQARKRAEVEMGYDPGASAGPSSALARCSARASRRMTGRCTATSASCACGGARGAARRGARRMRT